MEKHKLLFLVDKMQNGGAERQMLKIAALYSNEYEIHVSSLFQADPTMLEQTKKLGFIYKELQHNFTVVFNAIGKSVSANIIDFNWINQFRNFTFLNTGGLVFCWIDYFGFSSKKNQFYL